ncbi:MAG: hypothetical protein QMD13_00800 [Candidatus Bathyarchaeia archaeon]|nr:hypothetical protein [Candidatus Bathyarchaeia archaeon]
MSFRDWLHRKADEHAHNEILSFLLMILGVNLLMGGLLVIVIVAGEPSWLLIFPYKPSQTSSAYLGLILAIAGFALLSAGFLLVIHYDRKRSWCIKELEKSSIHKRVSSLKSVNEIMQEYMCKKKRRQEG